MSQHSFVSSIPRNLRTDLIQAGIQLLNTEGLSGFSLRKVAQRCNVSHCAPYSYFKSKEDLLQEVQATLQREFLQTLNHTAKEHADDPYQALFFLSREYIHFMISHPYQFTSSYENHIPQCDEKDAPGPILMVYSIFMPLVDQYLDSIHAPKHVYRQSRLGFWSMIHGLCLLFIHKSPYLGDDLGIIDTLLASMLRPNSDFTYPFTHHMFSPDPE